MMLSAKTRKPIGSRLKSVLAFLSFSRYSFLILLFSIQDSLSPKMVLWVSMFSGSADSAWVMVLSKTSKNSSVSASSTVFLNSSSPWEMYLIVVPIFSKITDVAFSFRKTRARKYSGFSFFSKKGNFMFYWPTTAYSLRCPWPIFSCFIILNCLISDVKLTCGPPHNSLE